MLRIDPLRRALGHALGLFLRLLGVRKSVVLENLLRAYPDDPALRSRLARDSYIHLGHLAVEILLVFGGMKKYVESRVEIRGMEHWTAAKAAGRGVIFLSNHVGNWEIMLAAGGLLGKTQILLVSKRLRPAWLHRAIERGRERCNVIATYEPRTLRDILSSLSKGGTVGFAFDQYAGPPVSVRVPFFGVPVGTSLALAAIVRRTGAVVLPASDYRVEGGRTIVEISPPVAWVKDSNSQQELAVNTARYAASVETAIRAHPEQWLWTHRRFKGDLSPLRPNEWSEERARE